MMKPKTPANFNSLTLALALILLGATASLSQSSSAVTDSLLTRFKTPDHRVRDVAFSPDGKLLAASYGFSDEGGITIWNVADRSVVANLLFGTKDAVSVPRITFSEDGKLFVAATGTGDVIVWTVGQWRSKRTILQRRGSPKDVTCSRTLLGFTSDDVALVYNLKTAEVIVLATKTTDVDSYNGISFTPDEKLVAITGRRGTWLWDLETKKQLTHWEAKSFGFFGRLSPTGTHLIAGGGPVFGKKLVQIWNVKERKLVYELSEFRGGLFSIAISHSGNLLALAGGDYSESGNLSLWTVEDGREIGFTAFGESPIQGLDFSPDDSILAAGSEDGFVLLYAVERLTGPVVKKQSSLLCGEVVLEGNRAFVRSLAKVPLPMRDFGYPWKLEIINWDAVAAVNGSPIILQDWSIESTAGTDRARIKEFRLLLEDRARGNSDHLVFGYTQNPGWDEGFVAKLYGDGRFVATSTAGKCLAYGSLDDLKTDLTTVRSRLISRGLIDVARDPLTLGADHYGTGFIELTLNGVPELRSDADDIDVLLRGGPAKKRQAFSRIYVQEKPFIDSILKAGLNLPRASPN
jgi:WD40 repeat protein